MVKIRECQSQTWVQDSCGSIWDGLKENKTLKQQSWNKDKSTKIGVKTVSSVNILHADTHTICYQSVVFKFCSGGLGGLLLDPRFTFLTIKSKTPTFTKSNCTVNGLCHSLVAHWHTPSLNLWLAGEAGRVTQAGEGCATLCKRVWQHVRLCCVRIFSQAASMWCRTCVIS